MPEPASRPSLAHASAAEHHAQRRLVERYHIDPASAADVYFDHLAHILAGDCDVRGWWTDGTQLVLLDADQAYWIVFNPLLMRIVTYLPYHPGNVRLIGHLRATTKRLLHLKRKTSR
jgi:hypothetical protein